MTISRFRDFTDFPGFFPTSEIRGRNDPSVPISAKSFQAVLAVFEKFPDPLIKNLKGLILLVL